MVILCIYVRFVNIDIFKIIIGIGIVNGYRYFFFGYVECDIK